MGGAIGGRDPIWVIRGHVDAWPKRRRLRCGLCTITVNCIWQIGSRVAGAQGRVPWPLWSLQALKALHVECFCGHDRGGGRGIEQISEWVSEVMHQALLRLSSDLRQ